MSRSSSKGRVIRHDGVIRTMDDLYYHFGSGDNFRSLNRRIYKDTECGASISVCGRIPTAVDLWSFGDTVTDSLPYHMGEGDESDESAGERVWFHNGSDGPPLGFVLDGFTIQTIVEGSEETVDSSYFKAGVVTGADVDRWIEQMEGAADHEWREANPESVREEWEKFFRDFFGGGSRHQSAPDVRTKKERLRAKLAAMTVENKCTPHEAATAKKMLDELDATGEPATEAEKVGVERFAVGDRVEAVEEVDLGVQAGDRGTVTALYHDDGLVGVDWDQLGGITSKAWAHPRELRVVVEPKALRGKVKRKSKKAKTKKPKKGRKAP